MAARGGGPRRTGSRPSTAPTAHLLPQQTPSLFPTGIFRRLVLTEGAALDRESRERDSCSGGALGIIVRRKAAPVPGAI